MKNEQGNIMTRDEAVTLLTQVLMDLAKNAVHEKRLTDYADQLEHYIAYLDEQENKENEEVEKTDEPKAE